MRHFSFFIMTLLLSCNSNHEAKKQIDKSETTEIESNKNFSIDNHDADNSNTEIIEFFADSTNIGEQGKYKVELLKYRIMTDQYVIVRFYMKWNNKWQEQNKYFYECDAIQGLSPVFEDFNNDNFNDLTFISATAARSANEVRRLFIFNEQNRELISILNSENYPNMVYNKELDCIDAFLVHGGTSTVFAKLKDDSLIEFASVHNDNNKTVYEINKFGKEKLLRKDTIIDYENVYVRYRNYKPLKAYEE